MAITLTPLDDITPAPSSSEHAHLISELDALPKKAAQFLVPYVEDELRKYKKALQTAANRFQLSVKFGVDAPTEDGTGTVVQAKLVPKQTAAGRPTVGPQSPTADVPAPEDATPVA